MRYIHFWGNAGFAGTDYDKLATFPDDTPDSHIQEYSDELAGDNAETYEYLATGWEGDFESEQEREDYYEDALCSCGWTEVSKEEYKTLQEDFGEGDSEEDAEH